MIIGLVAFIGGGLGAHRCLLSQSMKGPLDLVMARAAQGHILTVKNIIVNWTLRFRNMRSCLRLPKLWDVHDQKNDIANLMLGRHSTEY